MLYEFDKSALWERVQSPLYEFGRPAATVAYQYLGQVKWWPGIRRYDQWGEVTLYGDMPTTAAARVLCRRRYRTRDTAVSGAFTWTMRDTFLGDGFIPSSTGEPLIPDPNGGLTFWFNEKAPTPIEQLSGFREAAPLTISPLQLTFSGEGCTASETLSNEIPFTPELKRGATGLASRAWDYDFGYGSTLAWSDEDPTACYATQNYSEFNDNMQGFMPLWYGYDGTLYGPVLGTAVTREEQLAGSLTDLAASSSLVGASGQLWSFWFYNAFDDFAFVPVGRTDIYGAGWQGSRGPWFSSSQIGLRRLRFKCLDKGHSYWIGRALLFLDDTRLDAGNTMKVKIGSTIAIAQTGTLAKDEVKEVPLPWVDGHPTWGDFCQVGEDLSIGAICFAILDESPAAWCARTGYAIANTADDPVWTGDSGLTADGGGYV